MHHISAADGRSIEADARSFSRRRTSLPCTYQTGITPEEIGSMLQTSHATHGFSYAKALAASQKVNWRVEDIIGGTHRLDFRKPFMPESLARTGPLGFLDAEARLKLNQIRAHGYLYTFGLVEEFILPFVLDHARPMLAQDDLRTRALLQFASE